MTTFTGTTKAHELTEATIKKLLIDVALQAVIAQLIASAPWLGLPVVRQTWTFCAERLVTKIYDELAKVVALEIIEIKTEAERKAYEGAVNQLKAAMEKEDAEAIRKAEEEFRNRLRDLIRFPR